MSFRVAQWGTVCVPVALLSDESQGLSCPLHVCTCRVSFQVMDEVGIKSTWRLLSGRYGLSHRSVRCWGFRDA
jgi:hypothetical protein